MEQTRVKLTHEDYLLLPEDGRRHEIIDGEHFVTAAPRVNHQRVLRRLFRAFDLAVVALGSGEVMFAPMDVILSNNDVLQPDLLYVSAERSAVVQDWVRGAPDLVVEVLSPSSRRTDELLKRRRYEHFAVGELWVVDPDIEVARVYRLGGTRYARPVELAAERGDVLTTPLLPALAVPVATLFAD